MIDLMQKILLDNTYKVLERDGKVLLYKRMVESFYPEDYIEISETFGKYKICEAHRDKKRIVIEIASLEEASVYAVILCKRMFDDVTDREIARNIMNNIGCGEEEKIFNYIRCRFDESIFSVGVEVYSKISLLKSNEGINVKFWGKYLAQSATLGRGYVVLFNYCEKLKYIKEFYNNNLKLIDLNLDREKIIKLYILGIL